jgi:hypothetical protein
MCTSIIIKITSVPFREQRLNLFELWGGWGGSNHMNWEARALGPAGVVCERASTDGNHADEFWFCRIPMRPMLTANKIFFAKLAELFVL